MIRGRRGDPFGMPRVVNNGYGGEELGFAQMPGRIIMVHGYSKVWREIWMDGRRSATREPTTDHLTFTETIDDPAYYTQPFVLAKGAYTVGSRPG